MSKLSFGKSIEYKVVSEMMREGFEVYLPAADDHGVDLIAKTPAGNIVEVQIKARSKNIKGGLFAAVNHNPRSNFYFVFYLEGSDQLWILSSADFVREASQCKQGKNIGKYSLNVMKKTCKKFCVVDYHTIV